MQGSVQVVEVLPDIFDLAGGGDAGHVSILVVSVGAAAVVTDLFFFFSLDLNRDIDLSRSSGSKRLRRNERRILSFISTVWVENCGRDVLGGAKLDIDRLWQGELVGSEVYEGGRVELLDLALEVAVADADVADGHVGGVGGGDAGATIVVLCDSEHLRSGSGKKSMVWMESLLTELGYPKMRT